MQQIALSTLFILASVFAGAASAQDMPSVPASAVPIIHSAPAEPGWSGDRSGDPGAVYTPEIERAFDALAKKDLVRAEGGFANAVRRNPRDVAANLYLGATRMDLGKWADAKKHLEYAATKLPRHPDPKSRLGVTYARLGDTAGAYKQRAALVSLADACNGTCRMAPFIAEGIEMIDEALALPVAPG